MNRRESLKTIVKAAVTLTAIPLGVQAAQPVQSQPSGKLVEVVLSMEESTITQAVIRDYQAGGPMRRLINERV